MWAGEFDATISTMTPRLMILAGVGLAVVAQPPSVPSGADPALGTSARDIFDLAIERVVGQEERGAELQYQSRIATTVETFDNDGELKKSETTIHRRYPLEGELYEELIELDGDPLDARELQKERERREDFIREVRKRTDDDDPIETNDERQIDVAELIERFDASLDGVETIGGEECWVISFVPRPGKLPQKTRLDHMLNRSSGTAYVTQRDYGVVRVEFQIQKPTRYFWGLATLRHAAGRMEFERVEPDVWLPKRYDFSINLRVLFRTRQQQIVRDWIERERLPEPATAGD